jgi:PAS domain S-box-containing protein
MNRPLPPHFDLAKSSHAELEGEIEELRARLAEAEETLYAIRHGEVDAVIVATESVPRVYTLLSADRPYRNFVERMQEGALTLTPDGIVLYANRRIASLLGVDLRSIVGGNFHRFITAADLGVFADLLAERGRTGSQAALGLRTADGRSVPVHLSAVELSDEGQETTSVIVTDLRWQRQQMRDLAAANTKLVIALAERDRTEAMLRRAQKMEALGQLTTGVAHDFNNLLFAISGNLELLHSRLHDKWLQVRVESSQGAVERGKYLIQQLLAFGRLQHLRPQLIFVNALLRDLAAPLRSCVGNAIGLSFVLGDDLAPCLVDSNELQTAILNLAANAKDAMRDGGTLTITTEALEIDGDLEDWAEPIRSGQYITIAVTDTGHGMTPETVARAFDPFFTTKDVGKGTGLGLSRLYGFMRQSNGYVTMASTAGRGTTVRLFLPKPDSLAETPEPPDRIAEKAPHAWRILVVEDDMLVRDLLVEAMESFGYHAVAVDGGLAALQLLESDASFDAMVSDVVMPDGISGFQLVREVRCRLPNLPIVLSSGMTGVSGDAEAAGLDLQILRKPYRTDDLNRAIEAAVYAAAIKRS